MKNKRKLRLAALLAVLLLLFPAFAVEDDITDESDTSTTQTEETDQTAPLGGTDSIDPSADKPRVFDYERPPRQRKLTRPHRSAARIRLTRRQTSRACSTMKRC